MTKKVQIKGFAYEACFGGDAEYVFFNTDNMGDQWYTLIGPAQFTYEIPADFNPVAAKIAALEKERDAVRAEFAKQVRQLDERIANLQALEHSA